MADPYRVAVSEEERAFLRGLVGSGIAPARMLTRARVLRKLDHGEGGPGLSNATVAAALAIDPRTVRRVRRQVVANGVAATRERPRPDRVDERALDGEQEGKPARRRRTARTMAARRRTGAIGGGGGDFPRDGAPDAHKTDLKPELVEPWCLNPMADPDVVWHWEDELSVDERPPDPDRPVVGRDATSRPLLADTRPPLPAVSGHPVRDGPESVRGGVANRFQTP